MSTKPAAAHTYNLEVEGSHTFFVGEEHVWVHNAPCPKALSPVWKNLKTWRGPVKTDGNRNYFKWDYEHGGEIERYNRRGEHTGVIDPETGEQIKPAVPGRTLDVK